LSGRAAKVTAVTYKRAIVHPAPGVLVNVPLQPRGFLRRLQAAGYAKIYFVFTNQIYKTIILL